ncbi:MAG TPA: hypothetical protein VL986_05290 [Terracidiphilus sp.]|nr:hypothetical protein [Terracidiphilus sp.]
MTPICSLPRRIGPVSLVAVTLVLTAAFTGAQQPDAGQTQPAPPPQPLPPAVFQNLIPLDQLIFLAGYDGKMPQEIERDKRFREIEKLVTPNTFYFYHRDRELSETRDLVLDERPIPVSVRDGRYVMVASAGGADAHMSGRGFIWIDMQTGEGLGGIYFKPSNGEPTPTLAIYSRQLTDTYLGMSQLPPEFLTDLNQWAMLARVNPTSPRYFIPANKKKYPLIHDLDYCAHAAGMPAPPQQECDELNAEAADADLEAAYFMKATGNLSDATAWLLNPDYTSWIAFRARTCGAGLACRIVYTRRRTQQVLGRQ